MAFDLQKEGVELLPGLTCRLLDEQHLPQLNKLIASHYSLQHPLRQVFKVTKDDIGDYDITMAEEHLKSNSTLGIFDQRTGELIAVETNTVHDKSNRNISSPSASSLRLSMELRFANFVLGDLFADLKTDRYMYSTYSCVKSEYRARGVLTALHRIRMELTRLHGCQYIVGLAVSLYSQKFAKRAGYRVLREVPYKDLADPETGIKPDLRLSPIHTSCQLVYRLIPTAAETDQQTKSKF